MSCDGPLWRHRHFFSDSPLTGHVFCGIDEIDTRILCCIDNAFRIRSIGAVTKIQGKPRHKLDTCSPL